MKNRKNVILVICGAILLGLITFGIIKYFKFNKKNENNELLGYYQLEKVISYYQTDADEENETKTFYNDKKMYITSNQIETKIIDINNFYYVLSEGKIYYDTNKINNNDLNNVNYFEYEINDDYLIITNRDEITAVHYYKKITKEEY